MSKYQHVKFCKLAKSNDLFMYYLFALFFLYEMPALPAIAFLDFEKNKNNCLMN